MASAETICLANFKGGVGKSTTAVNVSAGLAQAGYRSLFQARVQATDSDDVQLCDLCWTLYEDGKWEDLAERWLLHRPKDWVTDVAAYIEGHSPAERRFVQLQRPSTWLPGDLVDPNPSDWPS